LMNMTTTDTLPSDAGVREELERGIAAAQAGDKMGAHALFKDVAARNENIPEAWVWLGGTSSNLDEAEVAFQRAVMLDPANEEANLGLRWIALRRQIMGQVGATDLSTGSFDRVTTSTNTLASDTLSNSSLNSGALKTEDADKADKAVKVKVGKSGSHWWSNIPMAARLLFALSIILYGLVIYFVLVPMIVK